MVSCLMAQNHYQNQCLISEVLWHLPENNFAMIAQATILCDEFQNYIFQNDCNISQAQMS